jgi:cupin superfamily acireductone dioxygenase involved in methionine salvage
MIKSKYIIFDRDGNYYEYNAENVFEAIDNYIEFTVSNFQVSWDMWNNVKGSCPTLEQRIDLVNQLVNYYTEKIERIIANYDYLFGDEISPQEYEPEC